MNMNLVKLVLLLKAPTTPQAFELLTEYLQIDNAVEINRKLDLTRTIHEIIQPSLNSIQTMNDFHKVIGETLGQLKQSQKVQTGSVVDLFARNMLLIFNQMDFNQLLKAWESFHDNGDALTHNPFLTDEHLSFLLEQIMERSSTIDLEELRNSLDQLDSLKVSYIKAYLYAILRYPFKAIKYSRKFYDMSLQNLIPKKVNHCIMNSIQLNMRMCFFDEALNSLSEGLRLSQTVSDELSINICLLNLFEIAYRNNYQKQSTLLLEYAVNHAQQLGAQHKLQNCLIYGAHIRFKKMSHSLLKKKNINWKDIVHQSLKQILFSYTQQPEIEQALQGYTITNAIYYGNMSMVEIALEQISQHQVTDTQLQQVLNALDFLILYQPLECLRKVNQIIEQSYNLSSQLVLQILLICYQVFEQFDDKLTLSYIEGWAKDILDINPDPFISEYFGLSETKNPKIQCKRYLEGSDQDLEIIKLCKDFKLDAAYVKYKLRVIEQMITLGETEQAKEKIGKINLMKFSQMDCQIQSQYWLLMGKLYLEPKYYEVSINLAVQIGKLEYIRESYYELAMFYNARNNIELRESCSDQFNKVDFLILQSQQNTSLAYYKTNLAGLSEYLYRYLEMVQLELRYL